MPKLAQALTAGELRKWLKDVSPDTPVKVAYGRGAHLSVHRIVNHGNKHVILRLFSKGSEYKESPSR